MARKALASFNWNTFTSRDACSLAVKRLNGKRTTNAKATKKKNVDIVCGKVAVCNRAANFSQETIDCLLFKIIIFSSLVFPIVYSAGGILAKLLGLVRKWRGFPPPKRMQTTHSWRMELTVVQTFNLWQWWCAISGNYSKSLQRRESPMQTKTDNEDAKEKWTRHFLDTMTASLKAQAC